MAQESSPGRSEQPSQAPGAPRALVIVDVQNTIVNNAIMRWGSDAQKARYLPALAAGTLLVFILCLGFYVTPAVLGGGRVPMISNLLDTLINQIPRWEQASAISTILLIVTLVIFAAYRRLDRRASI